MKVVVFAQEDSAADCLAPLASHGCDVLGVGTPQCAMFGKRCSENGFEFLSMRDQSTLKSVVESFKPELLLAVSLDGELPATFEAAFPAGREGAAAVKKYVLRPGLQMPGAPWPEFAPLWLSHKTSSVTLLPAAKGCAGWAAEEAVSVAQEETALSLRSKHMAAAARLLEQLLTVAKKNDLASATAAVKAQAACEEKAPAEISLDWDEETVERYVRAMLLAPRDPAVVADPASGDKYFIESIEQYQTFRTKILAEGAGNASATSQAYAADTHWYSNVGGSIVRMGDSNIHMPTRTDKKRKAAIPGAALSGKKKLRMNEPLIGPNAERYCADALASSWIGVEGPYVKQFERQLARICGCAAACAVHSGTAALYGAMKALAVSDSSHHVLVPSFTCAAAADAVVHAGGTPVPIDCDLESWGVSVEAVRRALDEDKDVVGVVVAPCYGVPVRDFHAIAALCREKGLWLCEDACESYGAKKAVPGGDLPGGPVGSLATLSVVSVRSEKMIGVGEGGAIVGNDSTLVARAKWWCSRAPSRGAGLWRVYEHDAVGQNFRMPEMLAAVGCAAAEMLPVMIERKRAIHGWYEKRMATHPVLQKIQLQKCELGDEPVWWITGALLPEGFVGEQVGMKLMEKFPDIEIRPGFFPLNKMAIFQSAWTKACPNTELLYRRLVCLPSSNMLQECDIDRVCDALVTAIGEVQKA
eukprot:TRINITY_DN101249_c0_g1_i1.p1 TRINITY_DN101249_c0_g1~~TRINITY_DN101249_c0_g1_i1.p1  ORF type:complete len:700 (+),score=198.00 TRINITY_DN101249_c0_g1_i1:148-2247(+)